ncbi:MAG TPA: carbamoyltransferase HypF, partial [Spirochaetia bacterium]
LFIADPRPLLRRLLDAGSRAEAGSGKEAAPLALLFHEAVALASLSGARRMRSHTACNRIALGGGVFQNLLLRDLLVPLLINDGFEVFLNEAVPPGDGGISLGQAWYAER